MIFPKSVFICEICGLLQQLAKRNCLIRKAHRATAAATAIDARCPRVGLLISWVPNQNQSGKQLWRQRASLASERFSRICALHLHLPRTLPATPTKYAARFSRGIRRGESNLRHRGSLGLFLQQGSGNSKNHAVWHQRCSKGRQSAMERRTQSNKQTN